MIIKIETPNGYIYRPHDGDIEQALKNLYHYEQLNNECYSKNGLNIAQLMRSTPKVNIIDAHEIEEQEE